MHIGVVLPQVSAGWDLCLDWARHAEEAGADSVWVVDHVLGFPPERGILEAWSLMAALSAATNTVEVGPLVLCQSFRNPALLAKMAATNDRISNGRQRVLIGTGWMEQEYDAFGWPFPAPGVRVAQLREAVQILNGLLRPHESFTFEGKHYTVREAVNFPLPVQEPLPVEIGGAGDRIIRTVAMMGAGWNCPSAALAAFDSRLELLRVECDKRGRSMSDLRLSCQIVCAVGDDEAAQHPGLAMFGPERGLVGSVEQVVERVGTFMDKGMKDFYCIFPPGRRGRACLERLIGEVKPQVA